MTHKTSWTKRYYIGTADGERIYMTAPKWDCGCYWSFGYLGNNNCHYHLDGLNKGKNQHLRDEILEHFDSSIFKNDSLLWEFTELALTAYALKEAAEVLGRGGSHTARNPLAETIINTKEVERINSEVLPKLFDAIEANLKANNEHNEFLESNSGMFVVTDGHRNQALEIMTYKQAVEYLEWQQKGGFNVSEFKIAKIKKGEIFKNGKGEDLVKLYDIETGELSVMLENDAFVTSANERLKKEIFDYRKGA